MAGWGRLAPSNVQNYRPGLYSMEEPHVEKKWMGTESKLSKKRKTKMMQTKSKEKVKERNRVRKL